MTVFLIFHITAGIIGLLSGMVAMVFRKGSTLHRQSGNVFFISMMIMSASGAYIALTKSIVLSVLGGALTFYLVATAWMAVKRKAGEIGLFEWGALVFAVVVLAGYWVFGIEVANSESGVSKDGLPPGVFYFFGSITLIAALMDGKMVYQGGVRGGHRIVRHLWRMSFAMLVATASFFLGQAQVFPKFVRETNILFVPVVMVILFLFFWLFKVLLGKKYNGPVYKRTSDVKL